VPTILEAAGIHQPESVDGIKQSLQQNGYYQPTITPATKVDEAGKQVDVSYTVHIGPQARVGQVALSGDPGMTLEDFRKRGKLKEKTKVNRDTISNAFTRLRKNYQKKDHLEATIALEESQYNDQRKQLDYKFNANQGAIVRVVTEGDKISHGDVDVVVTDGFSGNIALKTAEGTARFVTDLLRRAFTSSFRSKAGFMLSRPALHMLKVHLDPNNHNGAVFLGLNGLVVKSHGSANDKGVSNAVRVAARMVREDLTRKITDDLANVSARRAQEAAQ